MTQVLLPKVIFFDAAGTLIHLPRGVAWHYTSVAAEWGISLEEAAVGKAFKQVWGELPPPPETRVPRPDDDKEWWRTLVRRVLYNCGIPEGMWNDQFFEALYAHFASPGVWELFPDVIPTLELLRQRFSLGVLSNFDGRLRAVLAHMGIADWFEHWVISSEIGAEKPSPYVFQYAANLAGVDRRAVLHVGDDSVCDWQGAAAAGWQVFELERPTRTLLELRSLLR